MIRPLRRSQWPTKADPFFSFVTLLMKMDGENSSTAFRDLSAIPKIPTAGGDAKLSVAQSVFGGSSAVFDGSGDYISLASNSGFEPGSGDFTFECFVRPASTPAVAGFIFHRYSGTGNGNISISYRSTGKIEAYCCRSDPSLSPTVLTSSVAIPNLQWSHVAFTKCGLDYYLFINGSLAASGTADSHPPTGLSTPAYIGRWGTDSNYMFNGYIDEVRITKGICRYAGNFVPPNEPFPTE